MAIISVAGCHAARQSAVIDDSFTGRNGLIAAEKRTGGSTSGWLVTSGSLFRDNDEGWTGLPDDGRGEGDNGSAVFRMVSARRDLTDTDMTLRLKVDDLTATTRTPPRAFDGAHIWVRYQSDRQLYAVSVDRRDATMVIKKKCAGGDANGGTYFDLGAPVAHAPIPFRHWQQISVEVHNRADGAVAIAARRDGLVVEAIDDGVGCPPLREGGVGIRGDNAELRFDDIRVIEAVAAPGRSDEVP
ncbi:MAG TPA: hypothetical protein VMS92_13415 [Mycobacterium sp.]|nr:hypothetical protein [Mycobacterium sp.]